MRVYKLRLLSVYIEAILCFFLYLLNEKTGFKNILHEKVKHKNDNINLIIVFLIMIIGFDYFTEIHPTISSMGLISVFFSFT